MPRFVILFHELPPDSARASHWDFMLEVDEALRTWALAEAPVDGREIAAEALADHRLAYLQYEGAISGDRGQVTQWDAGQYDAIFTSAEEVRCELRGRKLHGDVLLLRTKLGAEDAQRWMFLFRNK